MKPLPEVFNYKELQKDNDRHPVNPSVQNHLGGLGHLISNGTAMIANGICNIAPLGFKELLREIINPQFESPEKLGFYKKNRKKKVA